MVLSLMSLLAGIRCRDNDRAMMRQTGAVADFSAKRLNAAGQAALRAIVSSGRDVELRWKEFHQYQPEVEAFYESSDYAPVWTRNGQPTSQALAYIGLFQKADEKGLVPEDYDSPRWGVRLTTLKTSPSALNLAEFDVALTVSLMRYVRALNVGRVNPKTLGYGLEVDSRRLELAQFLQKLEDSADPAAEIKAAEPPWPGYWRTLDALHRVSAKVKKDTGELLPVPQKPVLPGQPYPSISRLAALLRLIGDLPAGTQVNTSSGIYQGALVGAVKQFQLRHGLAADGRLTAAVVNDLNTPPIHRVRQIELTLERWRWASHSFSQPPVVINLPEFKLRAYDGSGHVVLFKHIIVGKAYHHRTPVFQNEIKYVVFRPYWEVPPSIQKAEIVPHIERDRSYFAKNNFEAVAGDGHVVANGAISDEVLAGLRTGRYRIRQKPGPKNALGRVKIMFPNRDNVYLHGTDAPQLFTLSRRDLSHGCMRVQDPADLVAWLLRNNSGWNLERVKAAMNGNRDNVTVVLAKPIPVLIVYATVATDESGRTYFYDDIYGFDAALEASLSKVSSYRSE
jgi:L,D-transpeptidase YcbB